MTRTFTAIAALGLLGACASVSPPEVAKQLSEQALSELPGSWASASDRIGFVEVGWIAQLNDPVLSELVNEAQSSNRNLQAAAANVELSWALARQAAAGLSPSLSLNSDAGRGGSVEGASADSYGLSLQAGWELDVWGRIRAGNQAVVLSAQSAEADYIYSQYSLAAVVARAYFLTIESALQVDVVRKNLETLTETNRIVEVQNEAGLATSQDVALSRSDLARTSAALIAASGAQRDALRALEVLLGRYPSADLGVQQVLPQIPPQPRSGTPSSLLERRPDIIAAERSIAAAFNNTKSAKAAQMPTISLTGSLGGSSPELANLLNPANVAWQAATSLVAPLIDGGLRASQVEEASAEQRQAIAAYAQTVLDALQEVENSLDRGIVLSERALALQVAAEEANKALRIARLRYDEGETDLLDVLTIQQRAFSSEADFVSIERLRLDEWIALNLSLGGEW